MPAFGGTLSGKIVVVSAVLAIGVVAAGIALAARQWPFTREHLIGALEEASGRKVQIDTFSSSYFPPGCTATGVHFLRHKHPELAPIITAEKLSVQASLTGLLGSPTRLSKVQVRGMHVLVLPASDSGNGPIELNAGPNGKAVAISEITADGALLEFVREDRSAPHYLLKVTQLAINDVGSGQPMSYRAVLTNTVPPGVIRAEGRFGPWNPSDMGATPVSGSYTYDDIALDHFKSIFGVGHASGKFSGPLSRLQTEGTVDVTGFRVEGSNHAVPLSTHYRATVNGTNGDVLLNPVTAQFRRTTVEVRGWIAARKGEDGKTASFDVGVPRGRVDDFLYLFTRDQPGMTGNVTATGQVLWPPGPRKFLEKIQMDLTCGMQGGRFTNPNTQDSINRISESAGGEKKKDQDADARIVVGDFHGKIQVRNGIARVGGGSFQVPGADARIEGSYNLLNQDTDLHGTLDTSGHVSDTVSGFKALVLKAITPLFKKRGNERVIPFQITGTFGDTKVGLDLGHHHPQQQGSASRSSER